MFNQKLKVFHCTLLFYRLVNIFCQAQPKPQLSSAEFSFILNIKCKILKPNRPIYLHILTFRETLRRPHHQCRPLDNHYPRFRYGLLKTLLVLFDYPVLSLISSSCPIILFSHRHASLRMLLHIIWENSKHQGNTDNKLLEYTVGCYPNTLLINRTENTISSCEEHLKK